MRLADQIAASVGGEFDRMSMGTASRLNAALAKAECFELSAEVVAAIAAVRRQRPSSVLSAIAFARPPYPTTWVEWTEADLIGAIGTRDNSNIGRPIPQRIGALIEGASNGMYNATFAWWHKEHGLNVCPFGSLHSVEAGALDRHIQNVKGRADIRATFKAIYGADVPDDYWENMTRKPTERETREFIENKAAAWRKYLNDDKEISALMELNGGYSTIIASLHAVPMTVAIQQSVSSDTFAKLAASWYDDLEGEPGFVEAFLVLLNTKNGAISERDDFSKLNRARGKAGKPPLREFQVTRMAISNRDQRGLSCGYMGRSAARQHYVRGHFKVRKSGVYWWSPYVRGTTADAVPRDRYVVR